MLTNLFMALPSEANEILRFYNQEKSWPRLEFNGLDNAALSGLLSALSLEKEAKHLERDDYLLSSEDGGPWVFGLPIQFVERVAALSDQDVPEISQKWASSKELSYMSVSSTNIEPVLTTIRGFAKEAVTKSQHILLWLSL